MLDMAETDSTRQIGGEVRGALTSADHRKSRAGASVQETDRRFRAPGIYGAAVRCPRADVPIRCRFQPPRPVPATPIITPATICMQLPSEAISDQSHQQMHDRAYGSWSGMQGNGVAFPPLQRCRDLHQTRDGWARTDEFRCAEASGKVWGWTSSSKVRLQR